MNPVYEKCIKSVEYIKSRIDFTPRIGLVLGSGLGDFSDNIDIKYEISYSEIEGFPVSTAPGHSGKYIFGYLNDTPIMIMKGRIHYYEGYSKTDTVLPYRVMALMGCEKIILTNAVGGINKEFKPGDFMIIKDHISFFVESPLIGENIKEFGPRFPDMSNVYDKELRDSIKESAKELNIDIKEGIFAQFRGPQFETPAEIRMLRTLGADAVGMSTAIEAITLNHMSKKVCAISLITNMAAGINENKLSEEEVILEGKKASVKFTNLIKNLIARI